MRIAIPLLLAALVFGAVVRPASADEDLRSTLTVVGDGRVIVQPDVAFVAFGVESVGPTLGAAMADASTRMQAVVDTLLGSSIAHEDIRTTRLGITPVYDQRDNTILRGYRVTNGVQAKLRDLGAVGQIVDAATAAGANRVDGVAFGVDDMTPFKDQARALAMSNARAKADQLAGLAGVRVVGVKSIAESDATSPPVRVQPLAAPQPAAAAPPPPVEPGQQEVRTQVTVTFIVS